LQQAAVRFRANNAIAKKCDFLAIVGGNFRMDV